MKAELYDFQAFLCKKDGTKYGMRFVNSGGVVLDIAFGQLFTFLNSFGGTMHFKSPDFYFYNLVNGIETKNIYIGKTKFDNDIEISIHKPYGTSVIPEIITPNTMSYRESDDIAVINCPNYTLRYKKNCPVAQKKFTEKSVDMLDAITNFLYRSGVVEAFAGYDVDIYPDKNYVKVSICSYKNEDELTERKIWEIVCLYLAKFLGSKVWGEYWNKILSHVELNDDLGLNTVCFCLSDKLVDAMAGRTDYPKIKAENYVGTFYNGLYTKNGLVSNITIPKMCNDISVTDYKFGIIGCPSMKKNSDRFRLSSKEVCFNMYMKTSEGILFSTRFYSSCIPSFYTYAVGRNILADVLKESDDYFDEYASSIGTDLCMKIYNTYSYIYKEYDISENVNYSVLSQRVAMFKEVWENSFERYCRKNPDKMFEGFDETVGIKLIKHGKTIQVGIKIKKDKKLPPTF